MQDWVRYHTTPSHETRYYYTYYTTILLARPTVKQNSASFATLTPLHNTPSSSLFRFVSFHSASPPRLYVPPFLAPLLPPVRACTYQTTLFFGLVWFVPSFPSFSRERASENGAPARRARWVGAGRASMPLVCFICLRACVPVGPARRRLVAVVLGCLPAYLPACLRMKKGAGAVACRAMPDRTGLGRCKVCVVCGGWSMPSYGRMFIETCAWAVVST
ncbi:hypothetical protein BC567DRAFT_17139 [Phyllosticta citribraziliensis]